MFVNVHLEQYTECVLIGSDRTPESRRMNNSSTFLAIVTKKGGISGLDNGQVLHITIS